MPTIERGPDGLKVGVRVRRSPVMLAMTSMFVLMFVGMTVFFVVGLGAEPFLIVFFAFFTLPSLWTLLWLLTGREILTIGNGALTLRRSIVSFGRVRGWRIDAVQHMRQEPPKMSFPFLNPMMFAPLYWQKQGEIVFDAEGRPVRFGAGLSQAGIEAVLEGVRSVVPSLVGAPQVLTGSDPGIAIVVEPGTAGGVWRVTGRLKRQVQQVIALGFLCLYGLSFVLLGDSWRVVAGLAMLLVAALMAAWLFAGREVLAVDAAELVFGAEAGPLRRLRRVPLSSVSNVRASVELADKYRRQSMGMPVLQLSGTHTVAFDVAGKTRHFGFRSGLDEAQARQIAAELQRHLPGPAAQAM